MAKGKKKVLPVITVPCPDLKITDDEIRELRKKFESAVLDVLGERGIVPHFEFFPDSPVKGRSRKRR